MRPLSGESAALVGSRVQPAPQPLRTAVIRARLPSTVRSVQVFGRLDSTNAELLRQVRRGARPVTVCVADGQTAGRGRGGRSWRSPSGYNVYVSVLERAPRDPAARTRLPLWVGIRIVEALQDAGLQRLRLKWPNDVLWRGAKLGGVLAEAVALPSGPGVVVGVGLNLWVPAALRRELGRPVADVREALGGRPLAPREIWVARMVEAVMAGSRLAREADGALLTARWEPLDALWGTTVRLPPQVTGGGAEGVAQGIDTQGRLRVRVGREVLRLTTLEDRWVAG